MPSTPAEYPTAWDFLNALYTVTAVKDNFDAAALHPYRATWISRPGLQKFSAVMKNRGDGATPLWITEFAGDRDPRTISARTRASRPARPADQLLQAVPAKPQGLDIQHVYWFLWRDPAPGAHSCDAVQHRGTAGLLRHHRTPKPAYYAFKGFTAETTPPVASITGGAKPELHKDSPRPSPSPPMRPARPSSAAMTPVRLRPAPPPTPGRSPTAPTPSP